MEFDRAKLDIQGSVGIVTLNHPEVMNAVSSEMLGGLMKALDEVVHADHDNVRWERRT